MDRVGLGGSRLIYKVSAETVFILGIIHGARDLAALWDEDERSDS